MEEDEFTVHDHGIMLLLGNGRRTKPRTKGKSVCMVPEKTDVRLITPMVSNKTQTIPRTPPQLEAVSGSTDAVTLKSPPPFGHRTENQRTQVRKVKSPPPLPQEQHQSDASSSKDTANSPAPSPDLQVSDKQKSSTGADVARKWKVSEKYFGFHVDEDDSVFQQESPVVSKSQQESGLLTSTQVAVKEKKEPRKSLMEKKPKDNDQGTGSDSDKTPKVVVSAKVSKSAKSSRKGNSRARKTKANAEKENSSQTEEEENNQKVQEDAFDGPSKTPSAKTAAKTPAAKSTRGKSTKKAKTPGTTKVFFSKNYSNARISQTKHLSHTTKPFPRYVRDCLAFCCWFSQFGLFGIFSLGAGRPLPT